MHDFVISYREKQMFIHKYRQPRMKRGRKKKGGDRAETVHKTEKGQTSKAAQ